MIPKITLVRHSYVFKSAMLRRGLELGRSGYRYLVAVHGSYIIVSDTEIAEDTISGSLTELVNLYKGGMRGIHVLTDSNLVIDLEL